MRCFAVYCTALHKSQCTALQWTAMHCKVLFINTTSLACLAACCCMQTSLGMSRQLQQQKTHCDCVRVALFTCLGPCTCLPALSVSLLVLQQFEDDLILACMVVDTKRRWRQQPCMLLSAHHHKVLQRLQSGSVDSSLATSHMRVVLVPTPEPSCCMFATPSACRHCSTLRLSRMHCLLVHQTPCLVLCNTVLCCIVVHCIVLYCNVLHCTSGMLRFALPLCLPACRRCNNLRMA